MSADEVRIVAHRYGCSTFRAIERTQNGGDHALNQSSTVFWFWFSSNRLVSYQEGRYAGTTDLRMAVVQDLCTHQRSADVTLSIVAPIELAGAAVYVDRTRMLGLSYGPTVMETIGGLKSGRHQIRIEKQGYAPVVSEYTYEPTEYWPRDSNIQIRIVRSAIKKR
jgi:hypothetical protein